MKRRWLFMATLVATTLLVVASCSLTSEGSNERDLSGRMLLWHALNTTETESLNQVIESFTALYPDVNVKMQVFSTTAELDEQFINAAAAGLGPDLVLGPATSLPSLLAARSLAPIDAHLTEAVTARFNPALLATLQVDSKTFGIPQSLDTLGLYVNRQLVETPATDLPSLLEQANSGTTVLVPINFTDAYWGLRAFGGQLFNEQGMSVLDQGGFANWLAWLRDARGAPGMIQDTNRDLLRQQFMAGNAGYYIGYASELNQILSALDPDTVGVYPLPNGPVGRAEPLVTSRAFFFSSVSSENQRLLSAELAKFVTNVEQSSRLMRLARQVPANLNVRINPRLQPIVASFVSQARNGIPKPLHAEFDTATRLGNEAYVRALEGGESPAEVAFSVNNSINLANGFEVKDAPSYACSNLGTLRLLLDWRDGQETEVLNDILNDFRAVCPLIIIETPATSQAQVLATMSAPLGARSPALIGLVNQQGLAKLRTKEPGLLDLDNTISAELLQRFAPIAVSAMVSEGDLYGLPFIMHVDALYYNRAMVQTPAQTLNDLRTQAAAGIPIALDTSFEGAFWGLRAFGTQLYADNGASLLDQGGMAGWLTWLVESRDRYGIQLTTDRDELRDRFLSGESAYFVGSSDELTLLREVLGDDLRVTLLPGGPGGSAQPLVEVDGFAVRADTSEVGQSLALEFMRFVTDLPSQTKLMQQANKLPANASVTTADAPFFSVFFEQAQTGFLLPATAQSETLLALGAEAYSAVLDDGRDATEVVSELTGAINEANGIVVTPTPTPAPTSAPEQPVADSTPAADEEGPTSGASEEVQAE